MKAKPTIEDIAARRQTAIVELSSRITQQRHEGERLHRKANYADERYERLRAAVEARGGLDAHDADCHITTCPEADGCEERDGGYLGTYMAHDCTCGVDRLRSVLGLSWLKFSTPRAKRAPKVYEPDTNEPESTRKGGLSE